MLSAADLRFLDACVELAAQGLYSTTPNPRVGALLVRAGRVIGRGWHQRAGEPHAEVLALRDAASQGESAQGATCYVSLEPCAHQGRTPPCADALIQAGVARVVGALDDPNPLVAGQGYARLAAAGIEVATTNLHSAQQLNIGFVTRMQQGRPWVRIKLAASLDGRTAMASGESKWLTSSAARADVQHWRARSCALLTGVGTVLADNPQLTVRDPAYALAGVLRQPLRIVLDSRLQTPPTAQLFSAAGPVLLVTTAAAAPRAHQFQNKAELLQLPGRQPDPAALLQVLAARDINELLVEAGPRLVGSLLAAGLWDELLLYMAPKLLGSTARPLAQLPLAQLQEALALEFQDIKPVGDELRLQLVRKPSVQ